MSTTATKPARVSEEALDRDLRRLYHGLTDGPWTAQGADPAHELAEEILRVRYADASIKDYGAAQTWVQYLTSRGFLTARRHPDSPRTTIYEKVPTPPEPDRRSFTEREQQALDAAARRERERLDREARFARSLAEQQAALDPMLGQISAALRRLNVLDKIGTAQLVAEAVQPFAAEIAELRQEVAAIAAQLAEARQADQTTETPRRFGRRGN